MADNLALLVFIGALAMWHGNRVSPPVTTLFGVVHGRREKPPEDTARVRVTARRTSRIGAWDRGKSETSGVAAGDLSESADLPPQGPTWVIGEDLADPRVTRFITETLRKRDRTCGDGSRASSAPISPAALAALRDDDCLPMPSLRRRRLS